jgi:phenylalanyl-tRNA synthetase beta chain
MQISLKWVEEFLNLQKVNLNYLIEKLTLGGFEIEKIVELTLDNEKILILDISSTPNRSDSLSVTGISKEIATLLNKPYKNSRYRNNNLGWETQFSDLIHTSQLKKNYSSFLAISLENLNNLNSPKWLQQKLVQSGLKALGNFSDFQSYILLETGYPFEVYDLNKIFSKLNKKNFNLSLVKAEKAEKFFLNKNSTYSLNEHVLTIKADSISLGIAGVTPDSSFVYCPETTSLLIEASIFDSTFIRQQSRLLGLRTERSARYEKSVKSTTLLGSLYNLINLLKVRNPNLICKVHTKGQILNEDPNIITLHYNTVKEILGPIKGSNSKQLKYINKVLISKYLDQLKFPYNFQAKQFTWQVKIPNFRSDDITRSIDLIEEIGRLYGFNKFFRQLPVIKGLGNEDDSYKIRKKFTISLLNNGFNELINYSLTNEKNMILTKPVKIINPLLQDFSNLKLTLLPNLIKTVQENLKQGNFSIDGFEYGHVFSLDNNNFKEREFIAGIFGGRITKSSFSNVYNSLAWFQEKGKIEQILKQFNYSSYWVSYSGELYKNILHPYKTAEIRFTTGEILGIFGQINPILAKKSNISTNLYLFEFNFDLIKYYSKKNKLALYNQYSLYPKIVKNLSFIVNYKTTFREIQKLLLANGTKFLKTVILLDEYKSLSIPQNHSSLCLELTFQSNKKTLQTKEVEHIIERLKILLTKTFNVVIRT